MRTAMMLTHNAFPHITRMLSLPNVLQCLRLVVFVGRVSEDELCECVQLAHTHTRLFTQSIFIHEDRQQLTLYNQSFRFRPGGSRSQIIFLLFFYRTYSLCILSLSESSSWLFSWIVLWHWKFWYHQFHAWMYRVYVPSDGITSCEFTSAFCTFISFLARSGLSVSVVSGYSVQWKLCPTGES